MYLRNVLDDRCGRVNGSESCHHCSSRRTPYIAQVMVPIIAAWKEETCIDSEHNQVVAKFMMDTGLDTNHDTDREIFHQSALHTLGVHTQMKTHRQKPRGPDERTRLAVESSTLTVAISPLSG